MGRAILALPGPDDDDGRENVAALLAHLSRTGEPLPEPDTVQRRLHAPVTLTAKVTIAQWLDQWLAAKRGRTPKSYEVDVRVHLKPRIGNIRIDRLTVGQLADMFDAIDEENIAREANNTARRDIESRRKAAHGRKDKAVLREELHALPPYRRPTGPTTQKNIRACLRAALNKAISHQLITFNPAAHLDMRDTKKTRPLVWTASRIEFWQQTGRAPGPVMVWTPEHTGAFLDHITNDPLYPLFHLITFRGLRRGEACGARWIDLDEAEEPLTIATHSSWTAGTWSRRHPKPRTATAPSPWTPRHSPPSANTAPDRNNTGSPTEPTGTTPDASSPKTTAPGYTPERSPTTFNASSPTAAYPRSDSTTFDTAPPPSPTPPEPTPKTSRKCSATPTSTSPPTPTPASCPSSPTPTRSHRENRSQKSPMR
nr:hypothetical protein [Fodinicola feengrottensis]